MTGVQTCALPNLDFITAASTGIWTGDAFQNNLLSWEFDGSTRVILVGVGAVQQRPWWRRKEEGRAAPVGFLSGYSVCIPTPVRGPPCTSRPLPPGASPLQRRASPAIRVCLPGHRPLPPGMAALGKLAISATLCPLLSS